MPRFAVTGWLLLALFLATGPAPVSGAELHDYVKKADPSYKWNLKQKTETDSGVSYTIEMTSQTWQGIVWEHVLMVYLPKGVPPTDSLFLWNDGGRPDPIRSLVAFEISKRGQVPVAFLYGIPNQPLFDGKKEDALIAETFVQYLKTEDASWPLLFPMVKSLTRAMDTIQAFAKDEWKTEVKSFVVSGASKRGWTSWLTGAADPRVKAIAPCVIDTLNMTRQLPHQVASFGKPSEMIGDYVRRGLVPIPDTGAGEKLWKMVDPWVYRESLTMPKLIVNGTNDPYWSQDALNLYWDDLKGDKYILYVPNAGHGLEQTYGPGKKDRNRVLSSLALFAREQIHKQPMPKMSWKHDDADGKMKLTVTSDRPVKTARLWSADATTRDFRKSRWEDAPVKIDGTTIVAEVDKPKSGWRTFFVECEYNVFDQTMFLSTQLRMSEAGK
jgi:PhoPQ-activated pathogenicity-related protein